MAFYLKVSEKKLGPPVSVNMVATIVDMLIMIVVTSG